MTLAPGTSLVGECRRPYSDVFDLIGGWLGGESVTEADVWVSLGFESESDHPERYRRDDDHWCIIEEDE